MRRSALVAAGLTAVLAAPAAAAGSPGPFVGAVRQGQTTTHHFDNTPPASDCIQVMTWYTVRLAYSPPVDTLKLTVDGTTVTGSNGVASMARYRSYCTQMTIQVTGTSVSGPAAVYTVTVTRDSAGGGTTTTS